MEGSGEAIFLLACPGLGWPGCALGGGPDRIRWLDKGYSLSRSGRNRIGGPSHSSHLGSGGGWEAGRSEWRFRWYRLPPG